MITLFFFGRVMEEASPEAFLLAYFLGAVGADLATFAMHYRDPEYATLGASGAVAGVLFASIVFFPEQSIIIFPIPVPIPGPLFAILYIVGSIYMARNEHRSVNHEAHIGGAVVGFIVGALMAPYGLNRLVDYVGSFF
jgi:membrane associated rhomboid family serine protease